MALMRRRSRSLSRRSGFRARRSSTYRYVEVFLADQTAVAPAATVFVPLITPVVFSTIGITTKCKFLGIDGTFYWHQSAYVTPVDLGISSVSAQVAMGIAVDKDLSTAATALRPYEEGFSPNWWIHRQATLSSKFLGTGTATIALDSTYASQRIVFRRRRYTRMMSASTDTLYMVVQSAPTAPITTSFSFFFRILIMEP